MWILPTRSRPASLQRFFEQYHRTKSTSEGVVWLDNDDPKLDLYKAVDIPSNWKLVIAPNYHEGLSGICNRFYAMFPYCDWYGYASDDMFPRTDYWDKKLIEAAGSDALSYGDDLIRGEAVSGFSCMGKDFISSLGWLALPGLKRIYIDDVMYQVAKKRGKLRYLPEVITEHLHFCNGKAPFDETYRKTHNHIDKEIYEKWLINLQ